MNISIILSEFSEWLVEHGYCSTDIISEKPLFVVVEFMKENEKWLFEKENENMYIDSDNEFWYKLSESDRKRLKLAHETILKLLHTNNMLIDELKKIKEKLQDAKTE